MNANVAAATLAPALTVKGALLLVCVPVGTDVFVPRFFAISIVFVMLIFSWWLTCFARAHRLISYALLIEGLTFVAIVASLFLFSSGRQG